MGCLARSAQLTDCARMTLYLADSSIWIGARNRRGTYLPDLLAERIERDEIATCVPVALEVLSGPPTASELDRDWEGIWKNLRWLPVNTAEQERALELLRSLARTTAGAHRRPPIDYIVAAVAEAEHRLRGDVVLWHWDNDLTVICEHHGIPHEAEQAKANGITA